MVVSWYTPNATATSMVQYGTASGSYTNKASGSSVSYYKVRFVVLVVVRWTRLSHHSIGMVGRATTMMRCWKA